MSESMKFLVSGTKAVNLANVSDFSISNNYLIVTLTDGREMRFVYGSQTELEKLFRQITDFLANNEKVFDCDDRMSY